ncbi:site-specific DNA-methyltransferase [Dermacoccus nishinomiyaensis]|uniref:site-specific DNA-methyltransferase n=1 Tax=Dermacoccus nishinomiyaensis TaxID=1274 RepID=UPI000DF8F88E|nr:site-specific DNA-methyltransferase [Dermacoccus nishinomiyaensis]QQY24981.1 site-specific DNA-methyltransferase [Dermacoccus nishinomiyaensis]STD18728.1 putative methyltransferase [Dermacoccus nishinomiyaensis]
MTDEIYETPASTPNFRTELAAQLAELVPEAIADGKVDVEKLKELLDGDVADSNERFGLFWPGKKRALRAAQEPTTATLKPDFDNSKDWDTTQNVFIEGDNLEVLKILQKHYHAKIKLIYIDPPYNTGKDFVYPDNYKEGLDTYLEWTRQVNEEGKKVTTNAETEGRYHSNWLNMMYPRLKLARNLLTDDGVIFISIDNHEHDNLRKLCNEVFGEGNFIESIAWNKRIPKNDKGIGSIHEYVLVYARSLADAPELTVRKDGLDAIYELLKRLKDKKTPLAEAQKEIRHLYKKQGYDRGITLYNALDANYRLWGKINMSWPNADTFGPRYDVFHPVTGRPVKVPDRGWRWKEDTFKEAAGIVDGKYTSVQPTHNGGYICGRVWFSADENMQPSSINYLDEVDRFLLRSVLSMKSDGGIEVERMFEGKSYFSYPKPTALLRTLISAVPLRDGDTVLDFFSGSATTGHAVIQLNAEDGVKRRHVQVQLPEPVVPGSAAAKAGFSDLAELARERLRRVAAELGTSGVAQGMDLGFRAYTLTDTNFSKWRLSSDVEEDALQQHLLSLRDSATDDASADELLTEILLKQGYSLTEAVSPDEVGGLDVCLVRDRDGDIAVLAYLNEHVKPTLEQLRAFVDESPTRIIVLEDAFQGDDELKTNLAQLAKSKGIEIWTA